jgi:protein gp37
MAENSAIEWTDHTFNPWVGCTKISPACDNCYAERWAKRSGMVEWDGPRKRTSAANWAKPIKWNNAAAKAGTRLRVFCASLADVFDAEVDPIWRENLFTIIDLTPSLDWLLLTKRPKLAAEYFSDLPTPPNVWVGTTVENKAMAAVRLPFLMQIKAPVRFLSMEPLLEPVGVYSTHGGLPDWIIVGGESGGNARYMHPDWARALRDQCRRAGIPFFFKQMTGKKEIPADLMVREFPASPKRTESDE